MTKLNTTFNSSIATGRILTNLNSVENSTAKINTCVVQNADEICQFVLHDEFKILTSSKFTTEELTKQCITFANDCLGIPEANYSKEEHFAKSKRDSLRESMKIAQVLMAKSLYITDQDFITKNKRVSNQGRMFINNPNTVAGTNRFNTDNDNEKRLGKSELLSIYSSVYGNSGSNQTVSKMSKSYADFLNHLKSVVVETKEDKTNVKTTKVKLPEGVKIEDVYTWQEQIQEQFENVFNAHVLAMTPEQAVKKGYIDSIDQHPSHKPLSPRKVA